MQGEIKLSPITCNMRPQTKHLAWFFALLAVSCSKPLKIAGKGVHDDRGVEVEIGSRVVVEYAIAMFAEGKASALSRDRVQVDFGEGRETIERPLADVYVPKEAGAQEPAEQLVALRGDTPQHGSSQLRNGSYAVCRMPDQKWRGCRIEAPGSSERVVDEEGSAAEVPWYDVLVPTAVTELNVRQRFERSAKRRAFRDAAKSAGRPRAPSTWRPALNERVIAPRNGAWVAGQVKDIRKGYVRIQWDGDHRIAEAPASDVAPEPPIEFAPLAGTFVLVRPSGGGAGPWLVMRIESTSGSSIVLSDEAGERHDVPARDVLPLDRSGS